MNFIHKPSCPDGENAFKIARRMKKRADCKVRKNQLNSLLCIRFNTKKKPSTDLSDINDFPKLKLRQLVTGIFWGTFQVRMCKSYIEDLLKNHECFFLDDIDLKHTEKDKNSTKSDKAKIFGIEIYSRHKRGEIKIINTDEKKLRVKYKVIIQYEPHLNSVKSIKSK